MMDSVFNNIVQLIVAILGTSAVTTFFNKKKQRAEVKTIEDQNKTTELQNTEGAIKIWRELAESFDIKLAEKESAFKELKLQLEVITNQNKEMIDKMTALEKDYSKLQKNYNDLKNSLK